MAATDKNSVFDQNALEYDQWYENHSILYESELLAIRQAVPKNKMGIEIGVGTGRFARALHIKYGVEPSDSMAKLAEKRGIEVYRAYAESLPIARESFDYALMVTTVCFLADNKKAFSELRRILKPMGEVILAIIDRNSELGSRYEKNKETNKFYKDAHFHSTEELTLLLRQSGFKNFQYWQTLSSLNEDEIENPVEGYGQGSFVVIKACKVQSKGR